MPHVAPPRMLLANHHGGANARSSSQLRGVSSNPALHGRGLPEGGGGSASGMLRPATVATSGGGAARREEAEVRLAAKADVSLQALGLTLKSMITHQATALVQEYGCGTLYNLTLANPEAIRARIAAEGGVQIVLEAMRNHPGAAGVQLNACALLKELAEYQPCVQLLTAGGARALLLASKQNHQLNEELLLSASDALRYLPEMSSVEDEG